MGAVTEYALRAKGGKRSMHPSHSIIAFGERKEYFVGEHHLSPTPFGNSSPFARLVEASGKILLLGVGLSSTTSFHRIEDKLGSDFPVKVYLDKVFEISCVDEDGNKIIVKTPSHDPFISRVRDCNLVRTAFIESGVMQELTLGNGKIAVIDAKAMEVCLENLLSKERFTIYGKIW
jgi:aminoglycoside 3-N-acetyltransferase